MDARLTALALLLWLVQPAATDEADAGSLAAKCHQLFRLSDFTPPFNRGC